MTDERVTADVSRPLRRSDLLETTIDTTTVVYDPVGRRAHALNSSAGEVWRRCDGSSDADAIVDDLAKTYNAPRERIAADVNKLLGDLASKKLLEL